MPVASALSWLLHPDLAPLLRHGAPVFVIVVAAVVFAESGLLVGFFLPGDSFLFSAGLVAGVYHRPNVVALLLATFAAAVAGDQVGYQLGRRAGPALQRRGESRLFKQERITRSREFFERHGTKAIVLARFVPIVRTFTPVVAGMSAMRYRSFVTFNVLGGALWAATATLLGWGLGKRYPGIQSYLTPAALVIVLLSVAPMLIELARRRRAEARAA
jgi:membrane-associated protein